jgi:small subunit ribosomal protein S16
LAVKLRLRRMGKKKQPLYKVVAADSRSPRDGKFLEAIGTYNPLTDPHTVDIKEERALYWLGVGAEPTDTVKSLLKQKGIILKRELMRRGMDESKIQTEMENWKKMKEDKTRKPAKSKKAEAKTETAAPVKDEISTGTTEVKGAASDETAEEKNPSAES